MSGVIGGRVTIVKKAFLFLFSVLCLSLFSANIHALDIEQKDLMVIDQSSTITIHDAGIGEFRIAPNIEFNKLNDYITYKLTLKNLDGKNYKVVSVKDTNSNSQIKTVYNYPSEMNPEDKDILISLVYGELDTNKTPLKSFTATISLIDDENNTEDITIEGDVTAPDTGRNLGTTNAKPNTVLSIMAFIFGVIIFYIIFCSFINRNRKIKEKVKIKNTVGIILAFLLIPGAIAIAANSKDITFEINFNQASINGPYKVTFNTDGGTAIAPQIIEKGDKASRPANPTKNGYMFQKWIDEEGNDFDFDTVITTDRNIKAIYNIETYSITYTLNGGTATNPTSYTVETDAFTLNNPEKAGFSFKGWSGTNLSGRQTSVTISKGTTGNLAFTAHFNEIFTVMFNAGIGSVSPGFVQKEDGEMIGSLPTPTAPEGYDFDGWYINNNKINNNYTVNGNVTADAKYNETEYTITYTLNGGTVNGTNPTTYTISTNDITLKNPVKEGVTFIGWTGTGLTSPTTNVAISKGSTGNRTYTANYETNEYTVSFNSNGGTPVQAQTVSHNEKASYPTDPTKDGHKFIRWVDENNNEFDFDTKITHNITLTAEWEKLEYLVLFDSNGGTPVQAQTVKYQEKATRPEDPERRGYTFKRWLDSNNNEYNFDSLVTSNVELTAEWEINTYNISYTLDGGTVTNPTSYTIETNTFTLNNPEKVGYNFIGWTGSNGTTPQTTVTITKGTTGDLNYRANWVLATPTYTVIYDSNNGTGDMSNQTIDLDVTTKLNKNTFTKYDHVFAGWNMKADGSGADYDDEAEVLNLVDVGETITLYAIWIGPADLDTGSNINFKMKNMVNNTTGAYLNYTDRKIKAFKRASSLPSDFEPSDANTISLTTSSEPVYIFFDETDGTMYFYAKTSRIYLNQNSSSLFYNITELTDIDGCEFFDSSKATSMNRMFSHAGITNIDALSSWDTSAVTDMAGMFFEASSLKNIDGAFEWDTSAVIGMYDMFRGASSLTDIDGASEWDTSAVTNMTRMFENASSLTDIDGASGWDTSAVTNMSYMFRSASSLENINGASKWDVSAVTNMSYMFSGASSLENINGASEWDTSAVTNMSSMFNSASSLMNIDALIKWDTSAVIDMSWMFSSARSLANINGASEWDVSAVTNMYMMFSGAQSLVNIDGASEWDVSAVTNMSYMFNAVVSLANINALSEWDTSAVTDMSSMFNTAKSLEDVSGASEWDTSAVTNMKGLFSGTDALRNINSISKWDTSAVTNMSSMFSLSAIEDLSGMKKWDTSAVTDMSWMFSDARSLANIDGLSEWDTSAVTNMKGIFNGTSSLADINGASEWDTSAVTDMSTMFLFSTISDISGMTKWDVSAVTNMKSMFSSAKFITNADALAEWDTSAVTDMSEMFHSARALADISGLERWDVSNVKTMSSMFVYAVALTDISSLSNWQTTSLTNIYQMFRYADDIDATVLNNWDVSKLTQKSYAFSCPADKMPSWY